MAIVFVDSFDHYTTSAAAALKGWTWTNATINSSAGRRGTSGMRLVSNGNETLLQPTSPAPSGATCIVQHSYGVSVGFTTRDLLRIYDGATLHVAITQNSDGSLAAKRNTTTLGTSATGVIVGGVVNFLEVKALIHDSAGTVDVLVNGVSVLSLSSQDTRNGGNASWSRIGFLGNLNSGNVDIDDLVVMDGTGSTNNDFIGDARVNYGVPIGDGAHTDGTPSTGATRYQVVDETAPNGDTDYATITGVGDADTFDVTSLTPSGTTILGVQTLVYCEKTDAAACSAAIVTRRSSTDYAGSTVALATSYTYLREVRETDPATSAAWTESNFNAAEFGYVRQA